MFQGKWRPPLHPSILPLAFTIGLAVGLLAVSASGQAPGNCAASERDGERNQSRLTLFLQFTAGRVALDRLKSQGHLKASLLFQCRLRKLTLAQAEKQLLDDVAHSLAQQPLFEDFIKSVFTSSDLPPLPDVLKSGSLTGPVFMQELAAWLQRANLSDNPQDLLDDFFDEKALRNTPLVAFDLGLGNRVDVASATVELSVADPLGDLAQVRDYEFVVPSAPAHAVAGARYIAPRAEDLHAALKPLSGELWRIPRIKAYLLDYFANARSGYERSAGEINVSVAGDQPKRIQILPVPQLTGIVVRGRKGDPIFDDEPRIRLALRQLLSDEDYAAFLARPLGATGTRLQECPAQPDEPDAPRETAGLPQLRCQFIRWLDLAPDRPLPYRNLFNHALHQQSLAERGFWLVLDDAKVTGSANPDENDENADDAPPLQELIVVDERKKTAPDTTTASVPTNPAEPATAQPAPAEPKPQRCLEKPCLNWLGGGAFYRPGQGLRFFGEYVRHRIVGGDLSLRIGNHAGILVTGSGAWNDLLFSRLNHRWSVQLEANTDSLANRQLFGLATNERRTGGAFRTEYEWLSNPQWLTLSFGGRQEVIELTRNGQVVSQQHLTLFEGGALWAHVSRSVTYRRVWQFEPLLRVSPGWAQNQQAFAGTVLSGLFHQYLPGKRDIVIHLRYEQTSRETPIFALPSLGGAESVRGFRQDAALGQRLLAVQNEFLQPLPGLRPDQNGLLASLRNKLQLAAFADFGWLGQPVFSQAGWRFGAGLGLRFQYGPHQLKLDWAYGIGNDATTRGRGRFYLSFSRELPRLIRQ